MPLHFSKLQPQDAPQIPRLKPEAEIAIWADVPAAIENGVAFLLSDNDIVLTRGTAGILSATSRSVPCRWIAGQMVLQQRLTIAST